MSNNPYLEEIRSWDWRAVHSECLQNVEENYEGEYEGQCFLGTVFSLYPSGKYYMPWACGNLEPCEKCGGSGELRNKNSNPEACAILVNASNHLRGDTIEKFGSWSEGKWPKQILKVVNCVDEAIEKTKPKRTCPECNGIGSSEAYQDELFGEALEQVANEHGLWITSGEGDPCDIMAGIILDESDIEEMETNNA